MGSLSAYALARLCYDTLLEYGVIAKTSNEQGVVTPALERVVEANTLLSGLGFESGGLAASHAIHNGLTVLEPTHVFLHGEKVAFGLLSSLFLTDKPAQTIATVYDFCEKVGLPTTLSQIGLENVSDEDLLAVAEASCRNGRKFHLVPAASSTSSVSMPSLLKMIDSSLIRAILTSRCVFSITFAASATLIQEALWVPATMIVL